MSTADSQHPHDAETVEKFETRWGLIQIILQGDSQTIVKRHGRNDGKAGVEMLRYEPELDLIHIFPRNGEYQNGKPKYRQLQEIRMDRSLTDWDPSEPISEGPNGYSIPGLPEGFGNVIEFGLTIPRRYQAFITQLQNITDCTILHIGEHPTSIAQTIFTLNIEDWRKFITDVDTYHFRSSDIVSRLKSKEAYNTIAIASGSSPTKLKPSRLPTKRMMTAVINGETNYDDDDREILLEEAISELPAAARSNPTTLGRLRSDIDIVTLEELINRFQTALNSDPESKEEAFWQQFFQENRFTLQQLFSAPISYVDEQINIRIPSIHGSGLRQPDFLLANAVSRVAHLVEIKTPFTKLLNSKPYRGTDGAEVYSCSSDLTGAVAQLLAQMESATTDLKSILSNTHDAPELETGTVQGALIIGKLGVLSRVEQQSFLRFRTNLHGISIITFDEVLERLKILREALRDHDPAACE